MLDEQELNLIFEALDALEKVKEQEHRIGTIFGALFIRDDETREEYMTRKELELEENKKRETIMKERIILLKAKLIGMRDAAQVSSLEIDDLIN